MKLLGITSCLLFILFAIKTKNIYDDRIKEARMEGFGNGYRCAVYRTFEVPTDCEPVKNWPLTMAVLAYHDSVAYRKFLDSINAVR